MLNVQKPNIAIKYILFQVEDLMFVGIKRVDSLTASVIRRIPEKKGLLVLR